MNTNNRCARLAGAVLSSVLTTALAAPAIAAATPTAGTRRPATAPRTERIVLPDTVTPDRYRIDITPDAEALTFTGSVAIELTVHVPVRDIVLNGAELVIDRATLDDSDEPLSIRYDESLQRISFGEAHSIHPGKHTLSIHYHGRILQQPSGLFVLDYESAAGKARALFTQFENADARRFLPCWDEPARKAVFELSATVPAGQMALSNMPLASSEPLPGGLKRVRFAATPRMSSYLLFFGSGDFERVHREVEGVDIGVVVKRGDTANAAFTLDSAAGILPYFNRYFDEAYPLPKLDLIAGPGASAFFGAMENWGAIFGFESELLLDPRISTESNRQRVYVVVAHEMAHQWFGDLVTMDWWDDVWLNEGFASWMESKVTDVIHPEWHMWLQNMASREDAMQQDAREGTHPVIASIRDVLEAGNAFDAITYDKGKQVIRTLETYLGADGFRAGVRRYIHDHAYGNAVTDELWRELDRDSAHPITLIAHDLTLQSGVPMIDELSASCRDTMTSVRLSQRHLVIDPDSTTARIWHVPVSVATLGGAPTRRLVAGAAATPVQVSGCGVVIVNAGQGAYFRTHYSAAEMAAITAHYAALDAADQLGVLNDAASLAYIGQQSMASFLTLIDHLPSDADPTVALAAVDKLRDLDILQEGLPAQGAYRSYASSIMHMIADRIGWRKQAGEPDNVALLREMLAFALGEFGDPTLLQWARDQYQQYRADPSSLDAAQRRLVLTVVALNADAVTWEQLHAMARSASSEIDRKQLYDLLSMALDPALAQRALDLEVSGEPPVTIVPQMVEKTSERHVRLAFEFALAHWTQLSDAIEPASRPYFLTKLLRTAWDPTFYDELERFAATHIPAEAHGDLLKARANVRYHGQIRTQRLPEIDRWLAGHQG